jgi:pyruvate/2-oxoglutarate dehydrogenase complex dihydrolipoamide acyltransferase (E2) component
MTPPRIALTVLLVSAFGCNKETPPTAEQPRAPEAPLEAKPPQTQTAAALNAPATAAAQPADTAASPAAASKVSESNFDLSITPKGAYKVGQAGEVTVLLEAKPPFKVNDQYPYKFKLKEAQGIKFPGPVVGKDAVKLEKTRVTMPVLFTPEAAGKHSIGGQLSFSVCTDDKCLIEKRDLALDIQAE